MFVYRNHSQNLLFIIVYVNNLNIIEASEDLSNVIKYLKKEFKIKDLEKTKCYLRLQITHLTNEIFVHQSTYTNLFLKRFYIDKVHPLNISMQVRSLYVKKNIF